MTYYVTESKIPFNKAFLMMNRFVILNMYSQGIWYVDKEHSKWEYIKKAAIEVAKTFGDKKSIDKLLKL